ncbi:MAG: hypothetical protein H7839_23880 [Magnetococcus sp. YQC-5]
MSVSAVQKALASGRIKKEDDGTIDPVKSDKKWVENTDPSYQRTRPVKSLPPKPNITLPQQDAIPDYSTSRAEREYYNAQIARQDYEQQKKILVKRKDVDDEIFAENRRVRDRLQNIPSRVAPVLAAMTDLKEIEMLLVKELEVALEELL